jgi:hypothetical protein
MHSSFLLGSQHLMTDNELMRFFTDASVQECAVKISIPSFEPLCVGPLMVDL